MAYMCQNCGVVNEDLNSICNPVDEEYFHKICSTEAAEVCDASVSAMKYSCECGSVSANPQHLCNPKKIE